MTKLPVIEQNKHFYLTSRPGREEGAECTAFESFIMFVICELAPPKFLTKVFRNLSGNNLVWSTGHSSLNMKLLRPPNFDKKVFQKIGTFLFLRNKCQLSFDIFQYHFYWCSSIGNGYYLVRFVSQQSQLKLGFYSKDRTISKEL